MTAIAGALVGAARNSLTLNPRSPGKVAHPNWYSIYGSAISRSPIVLTIPRQFLQRSHNIGICAQPQNRESAKLGSEQAQGSRNIVRQILIQLP